MMYEKWWWREVLECKNEKVCECEGDASAGERHLQGCRKREVHTTHVSL